MTCELGDVMYYGYYVIIYVEQTINVVLVFNFKFPATTQVILTTRRSYFSQTN